MTTVDIKKLLENPLLLFVIMLLGALSSAGKQIRDARKNGATVSVGFYFAHWPETVSALCTLVIAFVGLIQTDMLNVGSAWGLGYASNSLADIVREGGRSESLQAPPPPKVDER